jgi:hypothetical protein
MKYKNTLFLLDFSMRVYLAYFFISYGYSKFTGEMFNNISAEQLKQPLNKIDMFHLTWYWFSQNTALSYTVGFFQILSAIMLLFERTVILGVIIAFPILLNIFIIDAYCVGMPELFFRVLFYILFLVLFIIYRREKIAIALTALMRHTKVNSIWNWKLIFLPLLLALLFIVEILFSTCFTKIYELI